MHNPTVDSSYPNLMQNPLRTQLSYPFLPNHRKNLFNSPSQPDPLPVFKKTKIKNLNLHQLQIQAEDLDNQDEEEIKREQVIIKALRQSQNLETHDQIQYEPKKIPRSAVKRDAKITSQSKKKRPAPTRYSESSLFSQGFLPDVKKFYNTFKHLDKEQEKQKFFRNTVHHSESAKELVDPIKLAQNIRQNSIFPKKLGMVGRNTCHQLNQNNAHMTKRQMKAFANGITLMNVKKIGLSNNKLTKQNARLLFQNVPSKLQKINLKNTFKTKEVLTFLNTEKLKAGNLKRLNLSQNRITDTGLMCIEQVLTANSNLEILNLSTNLLTDQSCQLIGNFVEKDIWLRNLNLSWNQIAGAKSYPLFEAMSNSTSLLNVNLSRNKLGYLLNKPIVKKIVSKKKIESETKQKSLSTSCTSLESVCEFFKKNNSLLHMDLSFNSILQQDCEIIADSYNIFNESLVGLHFYGNSGYITNYLGYLVEMPDLSDGSKKAGLKSIHDDKETNHAKKSHLQQKDLENVENTMKRGLFSRIDYNSLDTKHQHSILKQRKSIIPLGCSIYSNFKKLQKKLNLASQCWLCHGWITETFTFEITKSKLQTLSSYKTQQDTESQEPHLVNVYIHLENYNYQPLLMKIHKNPKKAFKNMALEQQQKTSKLIKGGQIRMKTFHDGDTKKKPLESMNTITLCDGVSSNTLQHIEAEDEYIFYNILVKIPQNQNIKYFFTINGEVFLNDENSKTMLDHQTKEIRFETFNPFRKGLSSRFGQMLRKFKDKEAYKGVNQKITELVSKLPQTLQIHFEQDQPSVFSLIVNEMNIYRAQVKTFQTELMIERHLKFDRVYQKLIDGNQELTSEEYELLIEERSLLVNQKEAGSERYITSEKLIEEQEILNSAVMNENEYTFLKPRSKDFLFGRSDPKFPKSNFPQSFALMILYLNRILSAENSQDVSQLERVIESAIKQIPKIHHLGHNSEEPVFYPSRIELNIKNFYLSICQSAKTYYKNKIKLNHFTGEIIKVGNFTKEIPEKSQSTLKSEEDYENHKKLARQETSIKMSKVAPYVLIKYNMLKEEDDQKQEESGQDIYEKMEESKKSKKSQKTGQKRASKSRSRTSGEKKLTINQYKINIMKAERQDGKKNASKSPDKKSEKNSKNNSFLQTFLDVKEVGSETNISTISMKLVEEILFPAANQNEKQIEELKSSLQKTKKQSSAAQSAFLHKIQNWKAQNHLMSLDIEEKGVLKLVSQELSSNIEHKVKMSKSVKKITTKKPNKFNMKVNKFCSLEANSTAPPNLEINFLNVLGPKKRPSFKVDSKKVLFDQPSKNQEPFDIGRSGNAIEFDQPFFEGSKPMDANKLRRLQERLSGVSIAKQIEVFLNFDKLFDQNFVELSLNDSIETYIQKINKIIGKKTNTEAKTSIIQRKQSLKSKNDNVSVMSNQSTFKSLKKGTSKSNFRKSSKTEQDKLALFEENPTIVNKNIFAFLMDERKREHFYFPDSKSPKRFPFQQNFREAVKLDVTQRILNRFEFINVNLIKNITKKDEKSIFPSGAREIFLKEICMYRSFLINSPTKDYKEFIGKLVDMLKPDNEKIQATNSDFISKVKRFSFGKLLNMLQEHLLYTIYFLTKQIAFAKLSNLHKRQDTRTSLFKRTQKKNTQNSLKESSSQKVDLKQGQKSAQTKKQNQNRGTSVKMSDRQSFFTKQGDESFISLMKNHPEKFGQELKKQVSLIVTEILSLLTKLHIKYDLDLEKQKEKEREKDQGVIRRSERRKTTKKGKRDPEKSQERSKAESMFSGKSSQNLPREGSRSKKKKVTLKLSLGEQDSDRATSKKKKKRSIVFGNDDDI